MAVIMVKNPLTLEEKVSVNNLIGHDLAEQHGSLFIPGQDQQIVYAKHHHVRCMFIAISQMTLGDNCSYQSSNITDGLEVMQRVFKGKGKNLVLEINTNTKELVTEKHVRYAALYNLAKNGFNAMRQDGTVTITLSEHICGRIENPVFIPEGIKLGYFLKYDVHDTGSGFPKDKPLKKFLELGVTSRPHGSGFGLYFATLASKYLQAPLAVTSEPGSTHITLYHPINLV